MPEYSSGECSGICLLLVSLVRRARDESVETRAV